MNPTLIAEAEVLHQQAKTLLDYVPTVRSSNLMWTDPMKQIHLWAGSTSGLLTIQINMGDELITVLSADYTGVREYHPGLWVDYFRIAYIEAEDAINAARKHRSESEHREQELRYAPVDDNGTFGRKE